MSLPIKHNKAESPLRKNFDSFTTEHKLRDAQEEFTEAVYQLRAAEAEGTDTQIMVTIKRKAEYLDRKVRFYRYCIYSDLPVEGEYVEEQASHASGRCPIPSWQ